MRLTPDEKKELVEGADALGLSVGALMRDAGLAEIRRKTGARDKKAKR